MRGSCFLFSGKCWHVSVHVDYLDHCPKCRNAVISMRSVVGFWAMQCLLTCAPLSQVHLERSFGSAAVAQLAQSCISSQDSALLLIPALISSSDISTIAQDTAPVLIDLGMPRWTPGPGVLPLDAAAGPTLAGTATCAGGSSLDGTNRLRPPLARSDQQCIGAMMMDKHRQLFGRDAALERPFQPMLVSNQMQADALDIVLPGLQVLCDDCVKGF